MLISQIDHSLNTNKIIQIFDLLFGIPTYVFLLIQ